MKEVVVFPAVLQNEWAPPLEVNAKAQNTWQQKEKKKSKHTAKWYNFLCTSVWNRSKDVVQRERERENTRGGRGRFIQSPFRSFVSFEVDMLKPRKRGSLVWVYFVRKCVRDCTNVTESRYLYMMGSWSINVILKLRRKVSVSYVMIVLKSHIFSLLERGDFHLHFFDLFTINKTSEPETDQIILKVFPLTYLKYVLTEQFPTCMCESEITRQTWKFSEWLMKLS